MPNSSVPEITQLLQAWSEGDKSASDQVAWLVQERLHKLAHNYLRGENNGHILQTTGLVNEAWVRALVSSRNEWKNRSHFFGWMAQTMRHILIDLAKTHHHRIELKDKERVSEEHAQQVTIKRDPLLIEIHQALLKMEPLYPRQSRVIELSYFCGFTQIEIAEIMNMHTDTVRADLKFGIAWLRCELQGDNHDSQSKKRSDARSKRAGL